jgi:hypothetical protein
VVVEPAADVVLVVDLANLMGSRPDGWWRDRAAAATRLLEGLARLGDAVDGPQGEGLRIGEVVAVLEGRSVAAADPEGIRVVRAGHDGDSAVVEEARGVLDGGRRPLVVTADRGLRARLPAGTRVAGPGWLNRLLGR